MFAQAIIETIDRQIDANRAALYGRLHAMPHTARGWQNAWDRCPDLRARDLELFRQRGDAQDARDRELNAAFKREQRKERAKLRARRWQKCPTCGSHILAA